MQTSVDSPPRPSASSPCISFDAKRTSPELAPVPRRWYELSGADLVFFVLALVIFQTARQGLLDDPGLGWHLRNLDAMLAKGGWLTVDPFSEPRNGQLQTWYSNQWLGEVPFWLGERWAGLEGIAAVAALVIAFTLRCLYRMLLRDGSPWPVAVFWTSQAAMGISCSWVARPNLFTMLFLLVTARTCVRFHEGACSRGRTLWLIPLFVLWANIHGGFVAGFSLLGLTGLIEAAQGVFLSNSQGRRAAGKRAGHILILLGGTFLATLLNPYGLSLYHWIFQLLGDPFFMDLHQEWRSPDFHGKGAIRFEWLMLLFPLLLAVSKRRPNLVELGLSLLWLHFSLTGFRYVALWVLVVVPLLARSSLALPGVREVESRWFSAGESSRLFDLRPGRAPWIWSVAFALIVLGLGRCLEGRIARHQPDIIPTDALDHFLSLHDEWRQAHGHRPVVFHSYDWGGYLTGHGGPDFRNWIDDRNEVQGREHVQDYFAILGTDPGWSDQLDHAVVQLICIHPHAPLAFRLAESPAWRERYRDTWAVIFERTQGPGADGSSGGR
jgi:hypothetical protein